MQVTKRTHLQARLQNTTFMVFIVIVIGLMAWLSTHYEIKADWTVNNRHTLSDTSKKLLDELSAPITITAYASDENNLRQPIQEMVERYQRHKADISLRFVDPFTVPGEVRERGIQFDGELIIDYQERSEHVRSRSQNLTEQELTSALQRVARTDNRLIVFLEGHGERNPTGFDNHDLSQWAQTLTNSGFEVQTLNFGTTPEIPLNTNVLVIASPRNQLLPGEITLIADYINRGGNLLWLIDPSVPLQGLETIAEKFGLTIQPGMIVDPMSQLLGVNNPAVVAITANGYGRHPVTSGFEEYLTLLPQASGLVIESPDDWEETALLTTNPKVWSETGDIEGTIEYNEETDIGGPLDIAFALTRDKPQIEAEDEAITQKNSEIDEVDTGTEEHSETAQENSEIDEIKDNEEHSETANEDSSDTNIEENENEPVIQEQRVIIVGEGDFLSNAFLGFGGNLDLGVKIMNWLTADDTFINIPSKTIVDLNLELSPNAVNRLGAFFLLMLPLGLFSTGISIWLRRRKA